MSGGSYNYAYRHVEDFADEMRAEGGCGDYSDPTHRALFRIYLRRVAAAMKAVEWNDSGDGARDESELILACVGPRFTDDSLAHLRARLADLESAAKVLRAVLDAEAPERFAEIRGGGA